MPEALLKIRGVGKVFESGFLPWRKRRMAAVSDIDLDLMPGETLGIVGESGSGKTTLLRMILRLTRPSAGEIWLEGREFGTLSRAEMRGMRRRMQAVFQDPASSFNPRQTVAQILSAPLEIHDVGTPKERRLLIAETLERVGLNTSMMNRQPQQLSGGQKQRVAIARAIILRPALVVADEPTSALDVSVQAQILNLFKDMKRDLGLTYLCVSHNLGVIRYVSDRVAVMRQGRIVEIGPSHEIFTRPKNEYTQALLAAVPDVAEAGANSAA